MKSVFLSLAVLFSALQLHAQKPILRFNEDGQFKIAQFTDMHISVDRSDYCNEQAEKTFARLSRVANHEKPDFIVFTGDIVTRGNSGKGWLRLLDSLNTYKIPFCVVFGNHDPEPGLTREEISQLISSSPYSVNQLNSAGQLADIDLDVLFSKENNPAMALYCMDSNDYSYNKSWGKYAWFSTEQIQWLRNSCVNKTQAYGGKVLNSLAFFHICLVEYTAAIENPKNQRVGRKAENECPGALNTGMFAAMVETGNIMGVFVGHDHDNDYVVVEKGVALGYGRFSGDDTTYNNLRPGVRLIVAQEGQRNFDSWILEDDGRVVHKLKYRNGKFEK
jgi:hypothetical protein